MYEIKIVSNKGRVNDGDTFFRGKNKEKKKRT